MKIGISTASLFKRQFNEEAVKTFDDMGVEVCEIFLNSYQEYTKEYAGLLNKQKGKLKVHSIHTLTTFFEPQLFGYKGRAYDDAFRFFGEALSVGKTVGAENYTMHGIARFKKGKLYTEYEDIGKNFETVRNFSLKYGIETCLENVEWAYYNHVGFLKEIKKYCPELKTCFDIKQARISGDDWKDYITEMGDSIRTVHLSDINDMGKICLPGKGTIDFTEVFKRLKDVNFDGSVLIEVYSENYGDVNEFRESLDFLNNIKERVY